MFALVDCNNFFVSCERLFNPKLENVPVMVLSSNDGCVVARSQEVKDLGIPMGVPYFKVKDQVKEHGIHICSSNFSLYVDMSQRVMSFLERHFPSTEVYSIDEAFISLDGTHDLDTFGSDLSQKVFQEIGLPVSVGIAPTKTLAKVATGEAKKQKRNSLCIGTHTDRIEYLKNISVGKVWGIGTKTTLKLNESGIKTAYEFAYAPTPWIRKKFGIGGLRTAQELQGVSCCSVRDASDISKSILSSQSFGGVVTSCEEVSEAVTHHLNCAVSKLRAQNSLTQFVRVFVRTSRHAKSGEYINLSKVLHLPEPTDNLMTLNKHVQDALRSVFVKGGKYKKAGILLSNFVSKSAVPQSNLFAVSDHQKNEKLMQTFDSIQRMYGKQSLLLGSGYGKASWRAKREKVSPRYTSHWTDIPSI